MFKKISNGVTNGNKLASDVYTRWISLNGPTQRLFSEYQSLVGVMYEHHFSVDKDQDLFFRLTDIETLLTLVGILPMLDEMNFLMKISQSRTMYIVEYTNAIKFAAFHWIICIQCQSLSQVHSLQIGLQSLI
jgi:hypothetical protein